MQLSLRQKEILIGSLLGDAHLEKNGRNVRLRVSHKESQENYLRWKQTEFSSLPCSKPRLVCEVDKRNDKTYKSWHFSTYSLEVFNSYWKKFYKNRIKIIPKDIRELANSPLSLAVWFMDDGYKRNDCNALRLNTDSFSLYEQKLLQECLRRSFKINSRIHKKGKYWNIYIPSLEAIEFCRIIKPYIPLEMKYKISLTP